MNDYSPGGVHVHMMTEEEREAERKRRELERLKYPWRYRGEEVYTGIHVLCAREENPV